MAQCDASATLELTQQSGSLTRLASDLGRARQKVRLYSTFISGLRHLPPQMKNQHGLNEEENLIGKKMVAHLSACGVTPVVRLGINNLSVRDCESGENLY
jgi:hypothetical protein